MRETQNLPIKAPITLLSSTPSALNCSPEVIILDFKHDDFEWEDWLSYLDQTRHNQDYMSAFCGFTGQMKKKSPEMRKERKMQDKRPKSEEKSMPNGKQKALGAGKTPAQRVKMSTVNKSPKQKVKR